jgi:hypothetical protein
MKPPLTSTHTHPVIACVNSNHMLQRVSKYVIMYPYSEYGKEVYRARDGRKGCRLLHARTSSRDTTVQARKCNEAATSRETARVQGGRNLAYQQGRICTVHEVSEECLSQREKQLTLSVAGSTPTVSEALSVDPCSSYRWEPLVQSHCVLFYPCQEGKSRTRGGRREYTNAIYGSDAAVV